MKHILLSAYIENRRLLQIPEIFNGISIYSSFVCHSNNLSTLINSPKIVSRNFICAFHRLTSLEGAPEEGGGLFACNDNLLTSLEGAPRVVKGDFFCGNNAKRFSRKDVEAVCKRRIYV